MGVALRWRAERVGLVFAVVSVSPLILEILWPAGMAMTSRLALSLGAMLGWGIQTNWYLDADYLFLKGVTRPQILASSWVRVALVGLLFWIDWAIALRASTGVVTRQQAETLVLAFGASLMVASLTKPGSWAQSQGKKPSLVFWMKFFLLTNFIPNCVSDVLINQQKQGRDLYPAAFLLVLAATPLCALVTLRAWKRSDLSSAARLLARP